MTYLQRLIHRAAVFHQTTEAKVTGRQQPQYDDEADDEDVPCWLVPGETRLLQTLFGRESTLQGLVFFAGGQDIRPKPNQDSGANDKLVIVDENAQAIGTWVVDGTRNPAFAGTMIVAGVRRVTK